MASRALVLGGGGIVGIAWETAVLKGMRDAGLDPAAADLIAGTSAGSIVGAQLAAGRSLDELYAVQLAPSDGVIEARMQPDLAALGAIFFKWSTAPAMTPELCAEIGAMALAAPTVPEDEWIGSIAHALGGTAWPERRLVVTAVDVESGAFATWDRDSGAPLDRAVASSCTVPGLFPPVSINGRRYMDGGVRSGTSADLAAGSDSVIVIAPIGASAEGIGAIARRQLDAEIEGLRAAGSVVELILPDAAALAAFGPNLMDPAHRAAAAGAGLRQGAEAGERLREIWLAQSV